MSEPFWRTKPLAAMTPDEWESLCDGCGRCCLVKIEDEDSGHVHYTDVRCRLLDGTTCRCTDYPNRSEQVPDCVRLTPEAVGALEWLPPTCGYRLVAEGRDLPWWHPLVSGDRRTVVEAGVSVAGRTYAHEDELTLEEQVDRITAWPAKWPRAARRGGAAAKGGK